MIQENCAASKRKGHRGELILLPLVGEPEIVVSRRLCPGGQSEIVSFARRFVCLESAEEVPEHRFIPKVGTEELWPVSSRCCQWQMEKEIAGRTHKERDWTNGPKDTRSSQPKIIRWKNDIFRQPVNEQSKIVPTALTAD